MKIFGHELALRQLFKHTPPRPYHLGLALSGGGARGFAHLGALKALEEHGIVPDVVSGTSAGAIAGAFYCAGIKPDDAMTLFESHAAKDFLHLTMPTKGFLKYDGFARFLREALPVKNIEDLQIPLYITASNFDTGECTVFTSGELVPRVMASSSIPVVFAPTKIDGVRYVDGGLFCNFPVTPIRPLCDRIIGVNLNPYSNSDQNENVITVAVKSYQFVFNANTVADRAQCDLLLQLDDVNRYNMFDIGKSREIFNIGYEQMTALLDAQQDNWK